jgi:hypothetical protein
MFVRHHYHSQGPSASHALMRAFLIVLIVAILLSLAMWMDSRRNALQIAQLQGRVPVQTMPRPNDRGKLVISLPEHTPIGVSSLVLSTTT